ncbi:MAG: PAS domain-containing sensor histidine kinase [Parasphingopyxis sp.]|uniref:PAS domain-containing sensor histidine kinase n=1 Tax=Parasphingopyxis sp. TaxID=1920299 RepID=UPI003F9F1988
MADLSAEATLETGRTASLRRLLAEVQAFICRFTADSAFDEVQPDWTGLTGQSRTQYGGHGWMDAIHPDDIETTKREWTTARQSRMQFIRTHRIRDRGGEWRRFAVKCVPQIDDDGEIRSWTALHADITDLRPNSREKVIPLEGATLPPLEYSAIMDQLGEGVIVTDALGQIVFVNDAAVKLHGVKSLYVDPENYTATYQLFTVDGAPYPPLELPLARAVLRGEVVHDARWRIRRPDGTEILAIGTAQPIYDSEGNQQGGVLTLHDDTARHAAEEQLELLNETLETRVNEALDERALVEEALLQAQKMEAVGQLTGGIAHDFNNLLTVISGSIQLLEMRLGQIEDEKVARHLDHIGAAAKRAAALTQRLLAFSRRQSLTPQPTDLNALISDIGVMIQRTIGENIVLAADLDESIGPIFVDSHQLENVLLNLALNARDAMPAGGQLWFRTEATTIGAHHSDLMPGDYAAISVIDTGTGMDEETIGRAFEPFFTTKEVGKGTGLGLSMIYGFAKQSGGHVEIASEPDVGTTIKLYLPAHRDEGRA